MKTLHRISTLLLLVLVASLPFELRLTIFGLTNLQWMFLLTAVATAPTIFLHWKELATDRLVIAAGLFVLICWISALFAEESRVNALTGAIRVTSGFALLLMALLSRQRELLGRVWCVSALAAATYGLVEYFGFASANLFRTEDFYVGTTQRLSASFEYPNTAAAFFAISLPLVWLIPNRTSVRIGGTILLWTALILTYSRGAALAVVLSYLGLWALKHKFREWRPVATFVGIAVFVFGLASISAPLVVARFTTVTSDNPVSARYELEFTGLLQRPGVADQAGITIVNAGDVDWLDSGPRQVVLMSRWYDIELGSLLDGYRTETPITRDLAPGDRLTLQASFVTPDNPGDYLLIWDLRSGPDWYSRLLVPPAFAEAEIEPDSVRRTDRRDLSHWTPSRETGPGLNAQVSRGTLWRAAGRILLDHPLFGVGPDNYRLVYGSYLEYPRWDTNIRSNSLYLELLATTGLAGLTAFLVFIGSIRWSGLALSVGLGVFFVHGLVDVFLMTTPIYFAFWILAGLAGNRSDEASNPSP